MPGTYQDFLHSYSSYKFTTGIDELRTIDYARRILRIFPLPGFCRVTGESLRNEQLIKNPS
jgi:hypothetical protein